jgi:hypothetical protein
MTRCQDFPGDSRALELAIDRLISEPPCSEPPRRAAAAAGKAREANPFGRLIRPHYLPQRPSTHD